MKRELDLSLCARFPKIFAQRQMPMIRTAMSWGFECGDGWFNLIDSLCESIQAHVDHSKCWQVKAIQVDEKNNTVACGSTTAAEMTRFSRSCHSLRT